MSKIEVKFDKNNRASFEIMAGIPQLLIAIASLEGYISMQTGLSDIDIREMIDECKPSIKASNVETSAELEIIPEV